MRAVLSGERRSEISATMRFRVNSGTAFEHPSFGPWWLRIRNAGWHRFALRPKRSPRKFSASPHSTRSRRRLLVTDLAASDMASPRAASLNSYALLLQLQPSHTGKPLFCGHCGRTYNVKLCPRLHTNPRIAEVCSQCGSRDLSTPQPERSAMGSGRSSFFLSLIPGVILAVVSVVLVGLPHRSAPPQSPDAALRS